MERKDYGHGVSVQHAKRGESDEYRVCIGAFPVKNFTDEEEANDHAKKLAERKAKER